MLERQQQLVYAGNNQDEPNPEDEQGSANPLRTMAVGLAAIRYLLDTAIEVVQQRRIIQEQLSVQMQDQHRPQTITDQTISQEVEPDQTHEGESLGKSVEMGIQTDNNRSSEEEDEEHKE